MPTTRYKTEAEVPEDDKADAMKLADGEFIVVKETDTTQLSTTNRTLREEAARLKRILKKKGIDADSGKPERKDDKPAGDAPDGDKVDIEQIRREAIQEYEEETKESREAGAAAIAAERVRKLKDFVKATVTAKEVGLKEGRFDHWWNQFGANYELTPDEKSAVVKGAAGSSIKAAALKTKPEFEDWFVGTKADGSDSRGSTQLGTGNTGKPTAEEIWKNPSLGLGGQFTTPK